MSAEDNKALERRFFEAMNKRDVAAIEKLLAPNFVDRTAAPGIAPDVKGYKQFMAAAFAAFPDFHSTLEDVVAEGDKVAARFTARGTHKGEFAGIPASGKTVTIPGIAIHRIVGGKVAENWVYMDMSALMR